MKNVSLRDWSSGDRGTTRRVRTRGATTRTIGIQNRAKEVKALQNALPTGALSRHCARAHAEMLGTVSAEMTQQQHRPPRATRRGRTEERAARRPRSGTSPIAGRTSGAGTTTTIPRSGTHEATGAAGEAKRLLSFVGRRMEANLVCVYCCGAPVAARCAGGVKRLRLYSAFVHRSQTFGSDQRKQGLHALPDQDCGNARPEL